MATPIASGRICAHSLIDVRKNLAVLIFSTSEENGSRPRLSLTKILYGRRKRAWIEVVVGISEPWMVQDVDSIHPKLQLALLPPRQTPTLGQREIDIRQPGSTKRVSFVVAERVHRWGCIGQLVEPPVDRRIRHMRIPDQVGIQSITNLKRYRTGYCCS